MQSLKSLRDRGGTRAVVRSSTGLSAYLWHGGVLMGAVPPGQIRSAPVLAFVSRCLINTRGRGDQSLVSKIC